jgi:hypothetical protein
MPPWVEAFRLLVSEPAVYLSSEAPGRSIVKDVLADAKIHKQTTMRSGIASIGFDELIGALERASPSATVLVIGLIGTTKRGVLYCTDDDAVLGGVIVDRRR